MTYKKLPFPWVSKSKLKTYDYCPYLYYRQYVEGLPSTKRRDAIEGTNMHMVFAKFFGGLIKEDVIPFYNIDVCTPIGRHPFRRFVYERCMEYVKESQRGYGKYKLLISNFATVEATRWVELCSVLANKNDILKYFKPILLEKRLENKSSNLFGTVDRVDILIMPDRTRRIMLIDYKTGHVPKSVREGRDPAKRYSWRIPTAYMKEMHFYALFQAESKKLKSDYLGKLNKEKKYRPFKPGKVLKGGDIIISIYFLGGEKPYKVEKEFSYRSYKALLLAINELRSRVYNERYALSPEFCFDKDICNIKNCSNLTKCMEELNIKATIGEVEIDVGQ